jgi:hypothetical protein
MRTRPPSATPSSIESGHGHRLDNDGGHLMTFTATVHRVGLSVANLLEPNRS